jgi:hypothetical protein
MKISGDRVWKELLQLELLQNMELELKFWERSDLGFRKLNKISRDGLKIRNLYRGRKSNLKYFLCWQLIPHLHEFWIIPKILGPAGLTKLWPDRLVANLISNAPELHFEQVVFYGDFQRLYYDIGDMHILTPNIK